MRRSRLLLAALVCGLVGGPAVAADFELTPLVGLRVGGQFENEDGSQEYELDESTVYGLLLGFPLDDESIVEVELSYTGTSLQGSETFGGETLFDLAVTSILAGGRYQYLHKRVDGFVAGGAGITLYDPRGAGLDNEYAFLLSIGGGAMIHLGERLALRLEGRAMGTLTVDSTAIFCTGGACAFAIEGGGFLQGEFRLGLAIGF